MVFAMTLVPTGLSNGFRVEAKNTVDSLGIDRYLIKSGSAGPYIGSSAFAAAELQMVGQIPGIVTAVPLAYAAATVKDGDAIQNINVRGAGAGPRDARGDDRPGAIGPRRGRGVERARARRWD